MQSTISRSSEACSCTGVVWRGVLCQVRWKWKDVEATRSVWSESKPCTDCTAESHVRCRHVQPQRHAGHSHCAS